jgi:polyhydroxyalkanoate synthase
MRDAGAPDPSAAAGPDPAETVARLEALGRRYRRALEILLERQAEGADLQIPDPGVVAATMRRVGEALLADPAGLVEANLHYFEQMAEIGRRQLQRLAGDPVEPLVVPERSDRRFKDEAWSDDIVFDFLKQSYLVSSRWMKEVVGAAKGLDPHTRAKAEFYARQITDALAPSNFPHTNPVVLREAYATHGESLLRGLENLVGDLERGDLRIRSSRDELFEVGANLATTAGAVILENDLMQLIQYAPTTEQVLRRPLLIVPPWINKYYILDLRPQNSFVRWAVGQGFTVFLISWANPGPELAHKTFDDYLSEGPMAAMAAIERVTGERDLLLIGYCLGGTLTACLLAWLAARSDDRIKAATFLTTMTDFADPGDLGVFIDDEQLTLIEQHMARRGYLEAAYMQRVFSLLRANDLIWTFAVNNYLLGREPPPFDLLYWNADGTRMPHMMHRFYLRHMYERNLLVEPGGITLLGEPMELGRIRVPAYFLSTREDHIAPWKATYRGARRFGGPVRFVLGGSGHIAGVVNPPSSAKYGFWTNGRRPASPEAWLEGASLHDGSWWPDWSAWATRRGGRRVAARPPGGGALEPIERAPGRFVRSRAVD